MRSAQELYIVRQGMVTTVKYIRETSSSGRYHLVELNKTQTAVVATKDLFTTYEAAVRALNNPPDNFGSFTF